MENNIAETNGVEPLSLDTDYIVSPDSGNNGDAVSFTMNDILNLNDGIFILNECNFKQKENNTPFKVSLLNHLIDWYPGTWPEVITSQIEQIDNDCTISVSQYAKRLTIKSNKSFNNRPYDGTTGAIYGTWVSKYEVSFDINTVTGKFTLYNCLISGLSSDDIEPGSSKLLSFDLRRVSDSKTEITLQFQYYSTQNDIRKEYRFSSVISINK